MSTPHFLCPLSAGGHLVCFHILVTVNHGAMNLRVQRFLWDPDFSSFGYTPSSGGLLDHIISIVLLCVLNLHKRDCAISLTPFLPINSMFWSSLLVAVWIAMLLEGSLLLDDSAFWNICPHIVSSIPPGVGLQGCLRLPALTGSTVLDFLLLIPCGFENFSEVWTQIWFHEINSHRLTHFH